LTQVPPGPHLADLARRWKGLPGQPESPDPKDINLTGTWLADGYECYSSSLRRRVRLPTKRVSVTTSERTWSLSRSTAIPACPPGS
jgi:hypothetical protein